MTKLICITAHPNGKLYGLTEMGYVYVCNPSDNYPKWKILPITD